MYNLLIVVLCFIFICYQPTDWIKRGVMIAIILCFIGRISTLPEWYIVDTVLVILYIVVLFVQSILSYRETNVNFQVAK